MNRLSQSALMKIIFALTGLITGLLDYFIKQPDLSESIFKAFVVAAILFIGEIVLETRDAQKREEETYNTFVRRNRNLTGHTPQSTKCGTRASGKGSRESVCCRSRNARNLKLRYILEIAGRAN